MSHRGRIAMILMLCCAAVAGAADLYRTSAGPLEITCLGHASLMFRLGERVIYVDPFSQVADYSHLPKADLIFITHHHRDHLDPAAVARIRTPRTRIICSTLCLPDLPGAEAMANGDSRTFPGFSVAAVPAYNLQHRRSDGTPFHPRGEGNGYVFTFGDTRVYVAGDTENTPEMKALKSIDIAFLPVNLPYTMDAAMVVDALKALHPAVLYPYHYAFGTSDLENLKRRMNEIPGTKLKIQDKP